jgi:hypothetical protein
MLVLLVGAAAPARAFTLTDARPLRDDAGVLWVETRLEGSLEERVRQSLRRGMPATVTVRAELWRRRSGWFDRLERSAQTSFRLRREDWEDHWRLDPRGATPLVVQTLDSLQAVLERPFALAVGPLGRIPAEASCYLVLTASLRPIDVEDAEEVEGWLSGELRDPRRSRLGVVTGLPRSLFEAARNFAGFGDERARVISETFQPSRLPRLAR